MRCNGLTNQRGVTSSHQSVGAATPLHACDQHGSSRQQAAATQGSAINDISGNNATQELGVTATRQYCGFDNRASGNYAARDREPVKIAVTQGRDDGARGVGQSVAACFPHSDILREDLVCAVTIPVTHGSRQVTDISFVEGLWNSLCSEAPRRSSGCGQNRRCTG